jgi:hypothetical protein
MPQHEVYFSLPTRSIMNADAEFEIISDGNKLGSLRISRGSLEWQPANSPLRLQMGWEKFNEIMREHGTRKADLSV